MGSVNNSNSTGRARARRRPSLDHEEVGGDDACNSAGDEFFSQSPLRQGPFFRFSRRLNEISR